MFPDGRTVVDFFNGDSKESWLDGKVVYYYAEAGTTHTSRPDGVEVSRASALSPWCFLVVEVFGGGGVARPLEFGFDLNGVACGVPGAKVYEFANGQQETHFADGSQEIAFPDGTRKHIHVDRSEETVFQDGTRQRVLGRGAAARGLVEGGRRGLALPTPSWKLQGSGVCKVC